MTRTILAALLAPVAVVALASAAWANNNPIPGVDIIVKPNSIDRIIGRTLTGRDGRFVMEGLRPGTYRIRVAASFDMPRTAAIAAMHQRSNIKRISSAMVRGVQVVTVEAESDEGPAEAEFRITAPRGRVTGLITRPAMAPR